MRERLYGEKGASILGVFNSVEESWKVHRKRQFENLVLDLTESNGEAKCQSPLSVSDVPGSRLIHIWKSSEESDSGEYVEIIATFLNPCGVFQGIRAERAYYDQGELGDHPDVYNDFDSKKSNTMRAGEVIGYLRFAAHVQMVGRLDIARQSVIEAA